MDIGGDIILIDDSESDNYLHKIVISEEAGIVNPIIEFTYAEDALNYLRDQNNPPVAAVFLDINMPKMSGFEFMDIYTGFDPPPKHTSIYMLTTSISPIDRELAKGYSAIREFLTKPLTVEHLKMLFERQDPAVSQKDSDLISLSRPK